MMKEGATGEGLLLVGSIVRMHTAFKQFMHGDETDKRSGWLHKSFS